MMSQITPDKPHLFEDDLPESANLERKRFAEWAASAHFRSQADDFEIHDSDELAVKLRPLLKELGLLGKVFLNNLCCKTYG